ncbi:response regulator [Lusitaniella coriacea]|uniref:response regulator n=1 Tax=Lusitaniella coriacea TaxID=1983105 RepID=UPI003CF52295
MKRHQDDINKRNILIVDDTLESLQLLVNTLTEQGYRVRGASKSRMALKAANLYPPDLILLDIIMPEMDGYQVCKHLKSDPKTQEIPIIFISALDEVFDKVKGFELGGADYITKPFQIEEVLARIEHQLIIQSLQQQLLKKQLQLQQQNQQLQQEIEERIKAESAAKAATQAKSRFLANMSHELRTPLNAILGFTQVMQRDNRTILDHQQYLRIIQRSGEHLLELIDDVLDFSKIEAGLIVLNENSFNLYRFLDQLEEMLQVKAEQKNLLLTFNVAPDVPQFIETDEQKLRSVLINLLGNALKFTVAGYVQLEVELRSEKNSDKSYLHFAVRDTGEGIDRSEQANLFKAFVQTTSGIKSSEGTGLGLAISQKFVQLMGGEIAVESAVGEGTTFEFAIAVKPGQSPPTVSQGDRRVVALESGQPSYRILVVDDLEENQLLLAKLLEPVGFEVQAASNGKEAIALWQHWQPHLIFMDTRMPVLDGIEAIRQIRAKEQERKIGDWRASSPGQTAGKDAPVTIVTLTASAFEERRGEILAAGSNDFVRKPFNETIIFEKICEFLGARYNYESLPPQWADNNRGLKSITERSSTVWQDQLTQMPLEWMTKLERAANQVNENLILQLIEEIPSDKMPLADALKALVYDFRLDVILRLIEERTKSPMDGIGTEEG